MRKIICLLVVLLSSGMFASSVWAEIKKEDFVTLSFPRGITLDVPRNWKIATDIDEQMETTYLSLAELHQPHVTFDESILVKTGKTAREVVLAKRVSAQTGRFYVPGYGILLYIGNFPAELTYPSQEEVENMTDLQELDGLWLNKIQEIYGTNNYSVNEWSGISKVRTNNFVTLYSNFQWKNAGHDSPTLVQVFTFYSEENSFRITVFSVNDDQHRGAPDIRKIINSVRIEQ